LITGAGRDFGHTLAINFARLGADLLLSARKIENARAIETIIRSTLPGTNIACFQIDLIDDRQLAGARAEIERFTDRIDILIHNAGFWLRNDFVDTPDDDIVRAVASTATGPFILTKHLLQMIKRSSAADVIFLNGTIALRNNLRAINEAFSSAKAAQALFSKWLWHRLGESGVRLLTIYPADFHNTSPLDPTKWEYRCDAFEDRTLTARNVFDCIRFALLQDRICSIDEIVLSNNNGQNIGN